MQKNKLLFFLILIIGNLHLTAQNNSTSNIDSLEIEWCNYSPAENNINGSIAKILPPGPLPLNAELLCGSIKLTFMDVVNATGMGFDDPVLGQTRRQCVCNTMNYIQSVINFPPSITPSSPIEILFNASLNNTSPTLAFASPVFPAAFFANVPGYYGGFVFDYITTGINPAPINQEHGMITVNFGKPYSYCSPVIGDCEYDFRGVILHEFTHLLGIGSLITENGTTNLLESAQAPNVFTEFDNHFLYFQTGLNFDKLVDINAYVANGGINPVLPANMFGSFAVSNRVWAENIPLANRTNQPIYSRFNYSGGTTLSHFDEDYFTRTNLSPAFSPNYVMNGTIKTATFKSQFTKQDLNMLATLGYSINTSVVANFGNTPPDIIGSVVQPNSSNFPEQPVPAGNSNLVISTTNCNPVTIDVGNNVISNGTVSHTLGINDIDGDPISVFDGQFFNLRGCGNGGNNNNQLTINSSNNVITYLPRANFVGRAQFAFHLYDGKDRGAFVVITIDVTADNCFNNGLEHVVNGNFEEGKLIRTISNPNSTLTSDGIDVTTHYNFNRFADGQQFLSPGWQDQGVRESFKQCLFGGTFTSFPSPGTFPTPNNNIGDRMTHFSSIENFHQGLAPEIDGCNSYILSFDVNFHPVVASSSAPLTISLRNSIGGTDLFTFNPTLTNITNTGVWQTITIPFSYLNPMPSNYVFINPNGANGVIIDNLSIIKDNPIVNLSVTPSSATICEGQSVTLTASGASTYTWSPATGLSSTTGTAVTASPTTTTTYTVTGTDVNGCTATFSVTITVDQNCGCSNCNPLPAPSGILSATPPPFQNYCINNNITVTGNVALFLSEFQIDPNVTITVDNNAVLTITGSHLYACDKMWQGIVVKPGGRVVVQSFVLGNFINRSSLIEDAFIAIDVQGDPLINNNPLTVTDATFNRNEISIQITDYSTIIGATTYPMSVINTVFTSRDIPFTPGSLIWPNTNAIKATTPVPVLQSPYINNATYSPSNVNAYLKLPFIAGTRKPLAGIRLIRVGNTQTPLTPIYHEIKIGAPGKPKFNVFDNLLIGIDAHSTNFTCVNNVFQNNPDNQKLAVAINAIAEKLTNNRLRVIPAAGKNFANRFYDVGRAINSIDYYENIATHCDVRSSWNTTAPFTSPPVFNGKHGFIIQTNRFKMVNFSNNSMYNIENGITFFGNFGPFQGGGPVINGQYSGQINIINNTIRPHLPGNTVTTQYVANAITVSNVVNSNIFFLPNSTINVNNNTLTEVYRGIGISTWTKKDVKTNNNTISLVEDAFTATNPTPLQYGIAHQANRAATNFGNSIAQNNVSGFGITGSVVSGNPKVRAIITALCANQVVRCNNVNNTFKGIEFNGDNFPTSFTNNSMTTHRYGFVLDNAGFIGVQGNTTNPTDNRWVGTWTAPNFKTATLANPTASTAIGSELWVRNTSGVFNPNGSGFTQFPVTTYGLDDYFNNGSPSSTLKYVTNNPNPIACLSVVCCLGNQLRLEQVVQELDPLRNNIAVTRYINKNKVYRMLRDDPTLQNGSTILQNFYATKQQSNSETMAAVEEDFMLPDVFAAQAKTYSMLADNSIEQNYLTFFESYIKHQTDTINASDSLTLRTLAMGCPFTDGEVVYQARALFNAIYMSNVIFEDGCSSENARMMGFAESSTNTASTDLQVIIYPNPTTGETTLLMEGEENEWFIAISDIQGRKIHEKTYTTNKINLKLEADNGVYFVHITNNSTNETITKKLIINN